MAQEWFIHSIDFQPALDVENCFMDCSFKSSSVMGQHFGRVLTAFWWIPFSNSMLQHIFHGYSALPPTPIDRSHSLDRQNSCLAKVTTRLLTVTALLVLLPSMLLPPQKHCQNCKSNSPYSSACGGSSPV
jgi:hypothetical protein